ncbi:hypothetical protein F5Y10DRAFT_251886 [Nemania abortiva]|nr:hypothetical protein F5Y10DRAFT_251886 [Nemania abortiva]
MRTHALGLLFFSSLACWPIPGCKVGGCVKFRAKSALEATDYVVPRLSFLPLMRIGYVYKNLHFVFPYSFRIICLGPSANRLDSLHRNKFAHIATMPKYAHF